MPRLKTARRAICLLPARRFAIAPAIPGRRVEAQTGDDRVGVAVSRVNGDPFSAAMIAEMGELARAHGSSEQTSRGERERNRPRTIVAAIDEGSVTSAPDIGLPAQLIRRPDGALHREWRALRGAGDAVAQLREIPGHGWAF